MQPEEAIRLAKRLLDDPAAPETDLRVVAHLAYYGVYHFACSQLGLDPWNNYSDAYHESIRKRVRNLAPDKAGAGMREARKSIDRLWTLRKWADYNWRKPFPRYEADRAFTAAEYIFAREGIVFTTLAAPAAVDPVAKGTIAK